MFSMSITRSVSGLWYSQVDYVPPWFSSVGLLCSRQLCEWCLNGPPFAPHPALSAHSSYSCLARRTAETGEDWTGQDGRTNERSFGTRMRVMRSVHNVSFCLYSFHMHLDEVLCIYVWKISNENTRIYEDYNLISVFPAFRIKMNTKIIMFTVLH